MKVYIVGAIPERADFATKSLKGEENSLQDEDTQYELMRQEFAGACRALGAALVRNGHTIIVDISTWERLRAGTISAGYLVEGVKAERAKTRPYRVMLYIPDTPEPREGQRDDLLDRLEEFKKPVANKPINMDLKVLTYRDDRDFFDNMRQVDAFILMGGGIGTALTGQTAAILGKPVVALTGFGGAALMIYDQVLSAIYSDNRVPRDDQYVLSVRWDPSADQNRDFAEAVVRFTESLHRALFLMVPAPVRVLRSLMVFTLICFGLWIIIFARPLPFAPVFSYFVLLVLSAIIGGGLRILVFLREGRILGLTAVQVSSDLLVGILVAFGLILIYLVGGITFTGNVVILNSSNSNIETIALSMSILAFGAGFLNPLNQLRLRLGRIINNDDNNDGNN